MPECDGFFDRLGIAFDPAEEDAAVHAAWSEIYRDRDYSKFLIQCWFDTTYPPEMPQTESRPYSRTRMSLYLKSTPYATFEELLEVQPRRSDGND